MLSTDKSNIANSSNLVYSFDALYTKYPEIKEFCKNQSAETNLKVLEYFNLDTANLESKNRPDKYIISVVIRGQLDTNISIAKAKKQKELDAKKASEPYSYTETEVSKHNRIVLTNVQDALDVAIWNRAPNSRLSIKIDKFHVEVTYGKDSWNRTIVLSLNKVECQDRLWIFLKECGVTDRPEFRQHEENPPKIETIAPWPPESKPVEKQTDLNHCSMPKQEVSAQEECVSQPVESKQTTSEINSPEIENKVSNYPPIDYNNCIIKVNYDDGRYFQQNSSHIHKTAFDRFDRHQTSLHGSVSIIPLFTSQSDQLHSGQSKSSG